MEARAKESAGGFFRIVNNRSLPCVLLLVLAGAAVSPALCSAAEYFVNNSVASSGSGTISSPFRTIQEGLNRVSPGDIVTVRGTASGRTYSETPSLPISGTASQRLTLRAYPGEVVILRGSSGFRLTLNRDYWTIDGLTIDQEGQAADAVKINANHLILQNCEIKNGTREGIAIERATDVTIQDCNIHDFMWIDGGRNDAHCIMIDTGVSTTINGVVIQRNTISRCSGDGCQIFGNTGDPISGYAKNVSFLSNTFIDGTSSGSGQTENALDFKAGDGVIVRGNVMRGYTNNKTIVAQKGCRNITIEDNDISGGLSGIEMRIEGDASFVQRNQRIVGNVIRDMSSYAIKLDGVEDAVIANNTLANIADDGFRFSESVSGAGGLTGGLIQNNLSYRVSGAPSGTSLLSGVTVGPNGWYQSSSSGLSSALDKTGTNPGFVNASSGDYRLASGSPCIDAGIVVLGRSFSGAAPDLGAFEFSSGPDTIPPAAISDLGPR